MPATVAGRKGETPMSATINFTRTTEHSRDFDSVAELVEFIDHNREAPGVNGPLPERDQGESIEDYVGRLVDFIDGSVMAAMIDSGADEIDESWEVDEWEDEDDEDE
jgi:hypothetical protein